MAVGKQAAAGTFLAAAFTFRRARRSIIVEANRAPPLVSQLLGDGSLPPERMVNFVTCRAPLAVGAERTDPVGGWALPLVSAVAGALAVEEPMTGPAAKTGAG